MTLPKWPTEINRGRRSRRWPTSAQEDGTAGRAGRHRRAAPVTASTVTTARCGPGHVPAPRRAPAPPGVGCWASSGWRSSSWSLELAPRIGPGRRALPAADQRDPAALAEQLGTPEFWTALRRRSGGWAIGLAIAVRGRHRRSASCIGAVPVLRDRHRLDHRVPAADPVGGADPARRAAATAPAEARRCCWSCTPRSGRCWSRCCTASPTSTRSARRDRPLLPVLAAWARVRYVVWPTALPYVMTGIRLAASVSR